MIKVLKDIGEGKEPKYNRYSVSEGYFSSILDYIRNKDFARGMSVIRSSKTSSERVSGYMNPYLTRSGVTYLNKNV